MLQEIKTLVQTLNEQRDAYYNKDSPKMTDKEYDRLFDRLEELEKKSGIIFSNSPTQSVGYYPVSELAKVRHTRALLSLEKTKQIRELADFMENQDTLLMLKLDWYCACLSLLLLLQKDIKMDLTVFCDAQNLDGYHL